MEEEVLKLREQVLTARRTRSPLRLHGARTKDFYGETTASGAPLDLRNYRGIMDYEPSELVLRARCGTPLSELETALGEHQQFLGFEPPGFGADPTLGGIVASGLSGPRRPAVGAVRDFVLGATLMASDGEVLHFGGQVMKNVAGFDVARLLCGSLGILGILMDISLKVLPRPRAEETLRLEMTAAHAIEAFNRWAGRPLPVSATAWHEGAAWVRLSGAEPAVRAATAELGGDRVFGVLARKWWDALRHHTHPSLTDPRLWRIAVPQTTPPLPLPGEPLIEWGGAVRWYAGDVGNERLVREAVSAVGGSALRWRGPSASTRFHPLAPAVLGIHRRLKQHFDPEGIFNPGRLLAEL